jgi:hypothetical protein
VPVRKVIRRSLLGRPKDLILCGMGTHLDGSAMHLFGSFNNSDEEENEKVGGEEDRGKASLANLSPSRRPKRSKEEKSIPEWNLSAI